MCSREESQGGQLIPGLHCSSLAHAGLRALVRTWHRQFLRDTSAGRKWLLWNVRVGKGRDSVSGAGWAERGWVCFQLQVESLERVVVGSGAALAALGFACLTHKCVVASHKSLRVHEFRLAEDKFSQSEPFQAGFPLTPGSCCGSHWSLLPNPSVATPGPNPPHSLREWCVLGFLVYSWVFLGSSTLAPRGILWKALLYRLSHPCGKDMVLKHREGQKSHQRSPWKLEKGWACCPQGNGVLP